MDLPANLPPLPAPPGPEGELVVRNGRLLGTRRPLGAPLTLIGQASGCDLRLPVEGVELLHCVIVTDRGGPLLRDLDTPGGTRVNGVKVQTHRLVSGDVIEIGSVQLGVLLDGSTTREVPTADVVLADQERDGLRIQAAAVAAQQAALTEEEARLEQRATGLARQEGQLAAHLEERQQRLDEAHQALKQERAVLHAEGVAARDVLERERHELSAEQQQLGQQQAELVKQRQRLVELRRRLYRRYRRLGQQREAALTRREAEVAAETERLAREREQVRGVLERVNGELELGRRELREEWQTLGLQQQEWEAALNFEHAEQKRRQTELERRAATVAAAEQTLAAEQQAWQQAQTFRMREAEGLEARILNQRTQLEHLAREADHLRGLPPPAETPPPLSPALQPAQVMHREALPARVNALAELLLDQRLHLAEQWEQLLTVQQRWQEERQTVLAEMQQSAERLAGRERDLAAAEGRGKLFEAEVQRRQEQANRLRVSLEGWQVRLGLEQSEWQTRRDELLGSVEERERLLERRRQLLDEVQLRRNKQRKRELTELRLARNRCDEVRRQYSALWQECEALRERFAGQEREVTGQALALDRLRRDLVTQADDSVRADSWIERLTRRETARLESDARAVTIERTRLLDERNRLNDDLARLRTLEEEFVARQQEWTRQIADWERQRAGTEEELLQREQQAGRFQAQLLLAERQLRELRTELERLARVLIEESVDPRAQQAA